VRSVATDCLSSKNFRYWQAETPVNRLLDSTKPGHIEASDRGSLSRRRVPMLNFAWTNSVCKWSPLLLLLYVQLKSWIKSMHFCQIHHNCTCSEDLRKLGTYTHMHARTHACTHTRARARAHMHTHTCTHTHGLRHLWSISFDFECFRLFFWGYFLPAVLGMDWPWNCMS